MLQYPRPGFTKHNLTFMIDTSPTIIINQLFNTSYRQILSRIDSAGTFNFTAFENNYNMSLALSRTVNKSKI